ncbi:hypothetical protein J2W35_006453 [Variovorax boronicumulans]|uniref:hypothetical protein n=1 Tax=Variovorax boronicumulans TaxID=436515 RepID=UPI002781F45C|nr:hypothetical protein [Variovorax boronicumulans]MDQ0086072.1 hypothetical protein [Variovorax boronicumulans]
MDSGKSMRSSELTVADLEGLALYLARQMARSVATRLSIGEIEDSAHGARVSQAWESLVTTILQQMGSSLPDEYRALQLADQCHSMKLLFELDQNKPPRAPNALTEEDALNLQYKCYELVRPPSSTRH